VKKALRLITGSVALLSLLLAFLTAWLWLRAESTNLVGNDDVFYISVFDFQFGIESGYPSVILFHLKHDQRPSSFFIARYSFPPLTYEVERRGRHFGRFGFLYWHPVNDERWLVQAVAPHWFYALVLFTISIGSALPTIRAWKHLQRSKHFRCVHCGYDLRASPERCPECGERTPDAIKHSL